MSEAPVECTRVFKSVVYSIVLGVIGAVNPTESHHTAVGVH